jgi:hypothetical protein
MIAYPDQMQDHLSHLISKNHSYHHFGFVNPKVNLYLKYHSGQAHNYALSFA